MAAQTLKEIKKIWNSVYNTGKWQDFVIDLEIHKKLLVLVQPGNYYYWVLNSKLAEFEFLSPEASKILGYPQETMTLGFLFTLFHPDDKSYFLNFEMAVADFFNKLPDSKRQKYKIQYDFRFRKADGHYIRILNQIIILQYDDNQKMIRTLGFQTDITHLKKDGKPVLSLIGLEGEPSFFNIDVAAIFKPSREILTPKEKEVLRLLTHGKKQQGNQHSVGNFKNNGRYASAKYAQKNRYQIEFRTREYRSAERLDLIVIRLIALVKRQHYPKYQSMTHHKIGILSAHSAV